MKRLLLILFVAATAHAQWPAELDAYIEKVRTDWKVPGIAIAVVRDGKVIAEKGYGVRRLGSPELVDAHTVFDIASVSKSFTATAVATQVDDGKMRWDDPVRRHLPAFELRDPYRSQHATMRDLLSHRLGLENGNALFSFAAHDTKEIVRRMRYLDEVQPFRGGFLYSNVGYAAAAEAAASAAGMPFADLVRTRVLGPLGMTESSVAVNHDVGAPNHASGHVSIGGVLQPIRAKKALTVLGADAVNSTAHDMARWLLFQLGDGTWEGKRVVSAAAFAEMHEPQQVIPTTPQMRSGRGVHFFAAYGMGIQMMDYYGHRMLWHSGNANGIPTYMAVLPDDKIGVFVTLNSWDAPVLHGSIAGRILDALLGRTPGPAPTPPAPTPAAEPPRIAGTKPSRPLDAYTGTYVDELYGDMVVTQREGGLSMQFAGGEIADLDHWHFDVFRLRWRDRVYEFADSLLTFELDPAGVPRRLETRVWRADVDAIRR